MKLAANLLLAVFWQALGESLLLVDPSATDAALAIDLLADSNIGAAVLRTRAPQIVAAMNGKTSGAAAFDVDTMRKDLRYMADEATVHGSSLPLANRTLECFDRASREGSGGVDSVAYPAYWIAQQKTAANGGSRRAEIERGHDRPTRREHISRGTFVDWMAVNDWLDCTLWRSTGIRERAHSADGPADSRGPDADRRWRVGCGRKILRIGDFRGRVRRLRYQ